MRECLLWWKFVLKNLLLDRPPPTPPSNASRKECMVAENRTRRRLRIRPHTPTLDPNVIMTRTFITAKPVKEAIFSINGHVRARDTPLVLLTRPPHGVLRYTRPETKQRLTPQPRHNRDHYVCFPEGCSMSHGI